MSAEIFTHLQELSPASDKRLAGTMATALKRYLQYSGKIPVLLVDPVQIANANWTKKPKNGTASLSQPANRQVARKIMTLDAGQENNFTHSLNTSLLGGENYPVLTTVLGAAGGVFSAGGSLLFAATSTYIDVSKPSQRILARKGDEIWQVEEIGKVRNGTGYKAVHLNSYWLVDPFRGHTNYNKGWLIHEERDDVTLD